MEKQMRGQACFATFNCLCQGRGEGGRKKKKKATLKREPKKSAAKATKLRGEKCCCLLIGRNGSSFLGSGIFVLRHRDKKRGGAQKKRDRRPACIAGKPGRL